MTDLLIVDDHEIVRAGIKRLVENTPNLNIVADLGSGEEAYQFLQKNTVDLIIMDVSMPGKGGIETTNQIKKRHPKIKIIMLSMHDNAMIIEKAMKAGADGYILKNDLSDDLLNAVEKVMNNETIISASVDVDEFKDSLIKDLNNKEFEIFKSLASGEDLLSIAEKLNISYKTAANYQTSIKQKLNIKNILLGHHLDDLFENFFIRILRGSGLNGLVSLDKKAQHEKVNLIRPLLDFNKKDLIYVSENIFGSFVEDPSNLDDKFKRVKVRNFLKQLETEGLDRNKFLLTLKNLKFANETIKFYTQKNLEENIYFLKKEKSVVLKESFFHHSYEVVFRSFTEVIKIVGKKYYPVRGKKIDMALQLINTKSTFKVTLGGCFIKKFNKTIIVSKEQ